MKTDVILQAGKKVEKSEGKKERKKNTHKN